MTYIHTESKRHLSAKLAAGLAIAAFLVLGTFATSASAEDRQRDGGHRDNHSVADARGERGYDGNYGGGYYRPPAVVYGAPYDYPPPVVYGPSLGISLPGIGIDIQ
jgi:hypothetical protein